MGHGLGGLGADAEESGKTISTLILFLTSGRRADSWRNPGFGSDTNLHG
jgi:hypothetical protein